MTQVRAMSRNGFTLVYDTDDVENVNVSTLHHSMESEGPNGGVRRELTGYSSLDLHVDFKHGKRALWVPDDADAIESGMDTYRALDGAIEELRELQSDVRETLKTIQFLRNRRSREQESASVTLERSDPEEPTS